MTYSFAVAVLTSEKLWPFRSRRMPFVAECFRNAIGHAQEGNWSCSRRQLVILGNAIWKTPLIQSCVHWHKFIIFSVVAGLASVLTASFPGSFEKSEKRPWYPLFVHALNFLTFQEFQIIPCYLHVLWLGYMYICCIFNHTVFIMAICVQDQGSAVLYTFLWLLRRSNSTNLEKKVPTSIYPGCLWVLASYKSCLWYPTWVCSEVDSVWNSNATITQQHSITVYHYLYN